MRHRHLLSRLGRQCASVQGSIRIGAAFHCRSDVASGFFAQLPMPACVVVRSLPEDLLALFSCELRPIRALAGRHRGAMRCRHWPPLLPLERNADLLVARRPDFRVPLHVLARNATKVADCLVLMAVRTEQLQVAECVASTSPPRNDVIAMERLTPDATQRARSGLAATVPTDWPANQVLAERLVMLHVRIPYPRNSAIFRARHVFRSSGRT